MVLLSGAFPRYDQRLFIRETALHLLLVFSWQYISIQDVQSTQLLFADVEPNQAIVAVAFWAASGVFAEPLCRWSEKGQYGVWALVLLPLASVAAAPGPNKGRV